MVRRASRQRPRHRGLRRGPHPRSGGAGEAGERGRPEEGNRLNEIGNRLETSSRTRSAMTNDRDPPLRYDGAGEARVHAGRRAPRHHVCVWADRVQPRPYRQCPPGRGVRRARPAPPPPLRRGQPRLRAQCDRRRRQDHRGGGDGGGRTLRDHAALRAALSERYGRARRRSPDDRAEGDAERRGDDRNDRAPRGDRQCL